MRDKKRSLDKAAAKLARKIKLNLGATRKVIHNDGSVKRKRLNSTGATKGSVKSSVSGSKIQITGALHLELLDKGVSGTKYRVRGGSPYSRRKMPPKDELERLTRKYKPKDENGRFVKDTPSARRSMQYAIGKSIKERGLPKHSILTDALDEMLKEETDNIAGAIIDDLLDKI